jgi:hypothetical protein
MRILLLGTPRSGSTSLVKLIDSHISLPNYKMFIEPFNKVLHNDFNSITPLLEFENILVKNLFLIGNDEYPNDSFKNVYEYLDWCYTFFDKIIILDRIDTVAQSESFVVNETNWRERGTDWHTKKIYDLSKIDARYLQTMIERYTQSTTILKDISVKNNFPIFYYEDIFLNHNVEDMKKLFVYLEMELNINHFNEYIVSDKRKVRIEKSIKKLI